MSGIGALPRGWETATIEGLIPADGEFSDGDWIETKDQDPTGQVRLIQLADIGDGRYLNKSSRFLTDEKARELRCTFLRAGDLLIARMPDPLGRACVFPGDPRPAVTAVDVCIVRTVSGGSNSRWLMYAVNSPHFRAKIASLERGSTRKRISRSNLATIQLPVAPLPEQQRIVAEIEKHFTRLEVAVGALERARANLKRYRAAVLKAACEGRLVPIEAELARAEGRDYEPAAVLLERILKERRANWEVDQVTRAEAAGKHRKDDAGKAKYVEPTLAQADGLPLPEGWVWASSDAAFVFVTSGSRGWAKYYSENGAAFLRMGNLDHDSISLDMRNLQRVAPPSGAEGMRTRVRPGDILVSITADVGMIALVPPGIEEAYINQHVALARPVEQVNQPYIAWFMASHAGQFQLSALQRGATKIGLGLDDIRSVTIPLPPLHEQQRIIAEIDRRLSLVDDLERVISRSVTRAERLRQAVLKLAFEGRLVAQDPSDEPASVLLERIRAERALAETPGGARRHLGRSRTVAMTAAAQMRLEEAAER